MQVALQLLCHVQSFVFPSIMRLFALDTDVTTIRKRYCTEGECEVLFTRHHWLYFLFKSCRDMFLTAVIVFAGVFVWINEWPLLEAFTILAILWVVFVLVHVLKSYLDWRFDLLLLTSDKIVIVDQTSILGREEKPIHLDNVGGIKASTQFWDVFPFGQLTIHLKEGLGGDAISVGYIPNVEKVAAVIADVVTRYQRKGHPEKPAT
jgi:hypothetical protein